MAKIISIIVIAVVFVAALFFVKSRSETASNSPSPSVSESATPAASVSPSPSASPSASPSPTKTPTPSSSPTVSIVTYTDAGFSPKTTTIKAGATVMFKNQSSRLMWVASDPHPLHNGYPVLGGCTASLFDECVGVAKSQNFSFKFDVKGSWGYHNHLMSSQGGTIIVQ